VNATGRQGRDVEQRKVRVAELRRIDDVSCARSHKETEARTRGQMKHLSNRGTKINRETESSGERNR